ncbi:POP1-domain-containing protein [Schizophyllum commune Tattone D]|nr:POP1-domain-containing protein [Schizophyllum commune Tattone D]
MAPKRPNTTEETATARKKAKTTAARTIRIQEPSAQAGPSSVTLDSMKKLPGAIQVEKFAEARAFEIDAMHNAMQNSSEHSAQRAWQALPRHLRRRAASHDPRRVPSRLRERAKAEIDGPIRKRRHRVKKGTTTAKEFAKRQRDKSWLETHVWHAKRMIMTNIWGYRLAVKPTEKSFRPSHRAAMHGSILHDASYEGPIEVSGPLEILKLALEQCCDCQGPSPAAPRFADGSRAFNTYIYEFQTYPLALVSPASIIWQPRNSIPQKPANKSQGKGKGKAATTVGGTSTPTNPAAEKRTLWLRCHADAFKWVFQILQRSVTFALDTYNKAHPDEPSQDVEIADLRGELNIFEIMGPQANQVLRGALRAVPRGEGEFDQFWASLKDLQTSGAVPRNMIVGFTVDDPRLRFPPKRAKPDDEAAQSQSPTFPSPALAASIIWDPDVRKKLSVPKYTQKQLDERRAKNLVPGTPLNTLRLDDRVPVLLVQRSVEPLSPSTSGTSSLAPSAATSRTSSFNRTNSSHSPLPSPSTPSQPIHGWTLIFPAGWGMAFLPSLVHTGTRVAGQRERASQSFEAGVPHFPQDVPGDWTTLAQFGSHENWWALRALEEQARWERTPPSKRPNWAKLGTASMWMPDWRQVLGIEPMFEYPGHAVEGAEKAQEAAEEFVSAQREEEVVNDANMEDAGVVEKADEEAMDAAVVNSDAHPRPEPASALVKHIAQPWLLRGPETRQVLQRLTSVLLPAEALKSEIMRLRGKRGLPPPGQDASADRNSATSIAATIPDPRNPISTVDIAKADTLLQTALIQVRVQMCRRGRPGDLAAIYAVDDAERRNWARALAEKPRQPVMDLPEDSDSDEEDGLQDDAGEKAKRAQAGMSVKEIELANVMPDLKDNIGFVTTGNYSLARGEGFGIGSIALTALLKLEEQRVRMNEKFWFVKVKNRNSAMCRAARIEVVD